MAVWALRPAEPAVRRGRAKGMRGEAPGTAGEQDSARAHGQGAFTFKLGPGQVPIATRHALCVQEGDASARFPSLMLLNYQQLALRVWASPADLGARRLTLTLAPSQGLYTTVHRV